MPYPELVRHYRKGLYDPVCGAGRRHPRRARVGHAAARRHRDRGAGRPGQADHARAAARAGRARPGGAGSGQRQVQPRGRASCSSATPTSTAPSCAPARCCGPSRSPSGPTRRCGWRPCPGPGRSCCTTCSGPDNTVQILEVGAAIPWHACALGHAIVAYLPALESARVMAEERTPLTGRTKTTRAALGQALAQVRRRGYAVESEEATVGDAGIAAPIVGREGRGRLDRPGRPGRAAPRPRHPGRADPRRGGVRPLDLPRPRGRARWRGAGGAALTRSQRGHQVPHLGR